MKPLLRLLLCVCLMGLALTAVGQEFTLKDVVESGSAEVQSQRREQPLASPLAAALALREAGQRQDWAQMAQYADFRYLPDDVREQGQASLMRKLALIWEQHQILDLTSLSDDKTGRLNDGLPEFRERLGTLRHGQEVFDVLLQRVPDGDGAQVWKISNATVRQIPRLWDLFGYHPSLEKLERWLPEFRVFHMHNWQFVALLLLFVGAWLLSGLVKWLLLRVIARLSIYRDTMQRLIRRPLRLFVFFSTLNWGIYQLGLPLRARVLFDSGIFMFLASLFLVLGVIEFILALYISRAVAKDENYSPGFVRPLVTIVKIVVIILAILFWLDNAGYNMATILTGLGIGSLAVALAAQKTLENVFGAFTLYIARPIQPGDFCRFGNVLGVVEEIGLRSTRMRKLDRTVVNVPNSVFSSRELENLSEIDRRLYRQKFCLDTATESETLSALLEDMREILGAHERVLELARRVHFEEILREGFVVQVNAYIDTADFAEFLQIAEALNVKLLAAIEKREIALARWVPAAG